MAAPVRSTGREMPPSRRLGDGRDDGEMAEGGERMRMRAVAGMVAAGLLATSVIACAEESAGDGPGDEILAEVTGDVSGDVSVSEADVDAPAADVEGVEALSPALEVTTDGEVTGEVEIAIPLDGGATEAVGEDEVVFAMTAESADGPWELLPAEVRGDVVVVTTTHLSLFQAFRSLVGAIGDVARDSFEGLTSDVTAEADPPACDDEDGARDAGYDVSSDDGDTVYWCLGRDDEGAYLTVVNNRRYTLLLSHGDGLTVGDQTGEGEALHELLAAALTLEGQVTVGPRDSVTFRADLDAGGRATVSTEFDGVGGSLYQLDVAKDALLSIYDRFGVAKSGNGLVDLLDDSDCALSIGSGNAGTILGECFDFDTISNAWGVGAATVLSPLVLSGTLFSFFQTQLNALGDQLNGRDRYAITLTHGGSGGDGSALLLGASFEPASALWSVTASGDEQLADVTDAGGLGVELTDVAAAPDGSVYAVGFDNLYRLDPATGVATAVGLLGVGSVNALVVAPDGRLLAAQEAGQLVEVDPGTGAATPIGAFGGGLTSAGDLAFGPDGTLYAAAADGAAAGVLATVDPATGAATGVLDLPSPEVYGLAFAGGELYGLATAAGTSCPIGALIHIDVHAATTEQLRCLGFPPGGASSP